MDTKLPKPLSMQNTSRLPAPSSRLKAPSSYTASKAAVPVKKRSRSPDEAPTAKRARVAPKENQRTTGPATSGSRTMRPSNSAGSLNSAAGSRPGAATQPLKRNLSGGKINKATAPVKPSVRNTTAKPERVSRKGWNKTGEACIFIACDSVSNSVEVEESAADSADFVERFDDSVCDFAANGRGLLIDNVSLAESNLDTSIDGFDEEADTAGTSYKAQNEAAKFGLVSAQSNQQVIAINRDGPGGGSVNTCVAVVSCCQGVVTAGCNCVLCSRAGDSRAHVEGSPSGSPLVPPRASNMEESVSSAIPVAPPRAIISPSRSMLPRPVRFQPGNIELTPAPAKRSRKTGKRRKTLQGIEKSHNTDADCEMIDEITDTVNVKEKTINAGSQKTTLLENAKNTQDHCVKKSVGSSVGSGISKSVADCEDSEPESMQHEHKKGITDVTGTRVSRFGFKPRVSYSKSKTMPQKQAVLEMVHKENSGQGQVSGDMEVLANTEVMKSKQDINSSYSRSTTCASSNIQNQFLDTNSNSLSSTGSPSWQERRHIYTRSRVNLPTYSKSVLSSIPTIKKHLTTNSANLENSVPTRSTFYKANHKANEERQQTDIKLARTSGVSKQRPAVPVVPNKAPRPEADLTTAESATSKKNLSRDSAASASSSRHLSRCLLDEADAASVKSSKSSIPSTSSASPSSPSSSCRNPSKLLLDDSEAAVVKSNKSSGSRPAGDIAATSTSPLSSESASSASSKRNLPSAPAERRTVKYGQRCVSQERVPSHDSRYKAARPTSTSSQKNDRPPTGAAAAAAAAAAAGKSKRPAWDIKGRLQDMEEHMKSKNKEQTDILQQMLQCNERIASLESTNTQLSGTVAQKDEIVTNASKENDSLRKQIRETEDELCTLKRQFERDTENFEFTKASLRRQKDALEGEITALQQEVTGLKSSVAQLTSSQAGLQSELEATKLSLETSTRYGRDRDAEIVGLKNVIAEKTEVIEDANRQMREHETVRRKLHNTIQELKGNIRVFCRVRPLLGDEALGLEDIPHMNFPEEDNKTLELEKLGDMSMSESTISGTKRTGSGRYAFNFDRTFNPDSTQSEVFEEISQLVQSALDGYNVCIFAYGQTGSGKTYTMEGPNRADDTTRGMIPRAVVQIFTSTRELEEKGWQYGFEASFLEIYNETIRDLLGNHGNDVKHDIKLGANGGDVTVTHMTTVAVSAEQQIIDLLKTASQNRAVGETQCNERSSRSHSVFRLKISGSNDLTGEHCKGTLNLVDLAGSERLKESGATGQRLKETQAINKSLSNLGNVIMALGNKESHIPYRNSKLTYLLQNSLGGNSKTLMFVNVSPREDNFSETLNSLRFATKVNQCNIGTATKKVR